MCMPGISITPTGRRNPPEALGRRWVGAALAASMLLSAPRAMLAGQVPAEKPAGAPWAAAPSFEMRGGLAAFWDVGGNPAQAKAAYARGFRPITRLNTLADYPGGQKENIARTMKRPPNPWDRPPFFEKVVRRNIALRAPNGPYVHDIEIPIAPASKAWADADLRRASGAADERAFREAYYARWAEWHVLPLQWTKAAYPQAPVGLYGPQPFLRDFWGFPGRSSQHLTDKHKDDLDLWKRIDPFVDFYTASVYVFYNNPDAVFYIAGNVENNYRLTRAMGDKPVYAYTWLRFHDSNKQTAGQELPDYLVEAMAITPYFSGARGVVLWGWEPQAVKPGAAPYRNLPLFMRSLGRVAAISDRLGRGRLRIDASAQALWNTRRPLVRVAVVAPDDCVVMGVNPWQDEAVNSSASASCGGRAYKVPLRGKHTTILHVQPGGRTKEY